LLKRKWKEKKKRKRREGNKEHTGVLMKWGIGFNEKKNKKTKEKYKKKIRFD